MLQAVVLPAWCKKEVVVADAAYPSRANLHAIQARGWPLHLTVTLYLRRWPVELCLKELKGVVGLGQHQVTTEAARVERSVAVAVMAYLLLLRLRAKQIKPGGSALKTPTVRCAKRSFRRWKKWQRAWRRQALSAFHLKRRPYPTRLLRRPEFE
jgi:hypothetical protein